MLFGMTSKVSRIRTIVPDWTLADRLRKARTSADMTMREFAEAIDVPFSRYAQWEAGNNKPRQLIAVAKDIEQVTGVSATWIVGLSPNDPRPGESGRNNPCYSREPGTIGSWKRGSSHIAAA